MSFKFHSHPLYEQILTFAKDIYQVSAKFPDYEHLGLINHVRFLCEDLVEETAVTFTSQKQTDIENGLKQTIAQVGKITACIDLAHKLEYIDIGTHKRAMSYCEEITRLIHSTKDRK